eukprot:4507391-Alexandrium_andersonii.AAC.1
MHKCLLAIAGEKQGFVNSYEPEVIDDLLLELLKLCVPMKGQTWPRAFQDHLGDRLKGLSAPMKSSRVYVKAAAKAKAKAGRNKPAEPAIAGEDEAAEA